MTGPIGVVAVSLSIYSDALDPDHVTEVLACPFDHAHRKGDRSGTNCSGMRTGHWSISEYARDNKELTGEEAIDRVIERVSVPASTWLTTLGEFSARLLVSLELSDQNQGLSITPSQMAWLSSRGIRLDLDVHGRARPDYV